MEPRHERAIRKNRVELVRRLIINEEFLAAMETKNVITRPLREEILAVPSRMSQAGKLLDFLHRKGKKSWPVFLKALELTDQDELLQKLQESAGDARQPQPIRRPSPPQPQPMEHSGRECDDIDRLVSNDFTNIEPDSIRCRPSQEHAEYWQRRRSDTNNYRMGSIPDNPCGRVVIINNVSFGGISDPSFPSIALTDRQWSHIDVMNLNTLEEFGFHVDIKSNIAGKLLLDLIEEEIQKIQTENYDCYMFVVLSYGSQSQIVMTDGKLISPDWIQQKFIRTRADKPKVFLFHTDHVSNQAWEATDTEDGAGEVFDAALKKKPTEKEPDKADGICKSEPDAALIRGPGEQPPEPERIHEETNFLVVHSKAYVNQQKGMPWENDGTLFIRLLVYVITQYADRKHFYEMVQTAHSLMHDIQEKYKSKDRRPFYSVSKRTTLTKNLYLYAKPADM